MNRSRALAAFLELLDALEEEPVEPPPKRERPSVKVTDLDRQRAKRSLAKLGML